MGGRLPPRWAKQNAKNESEPVLMPKWEHLNGEPWPEPDFHLFGWHTDGPPPKSEEAKDEELHADFRRRETLRPKKKQPWIKQSVADRFTIECSAYGHKMNPSDRTKARGLCPRCLEQGRKNRSFARIRS